MSELKSGHTQINCRRRNAPSSQIAPVDGGCSLWKVIVGPARQITNTGPKGSGFFVHSINNRYDSVAHGSCLHRTAGTAAPFLPRAIDCERCRAADESCRPRRAWNFTFLKSHRLHLQLCVHFKINRNKYGMADISADHDRAVASASAPCGRAWRTSRDHDPSPCWTPAGRCRRNDRASPMCTSWPIDAPMWRTGFNV